MKRITAVTIRDRKPAGEKIAVLTAYDFPSARIMDEAGIDIILVGDSCGMAVMGKSSTLGVTMEHMVYHTELVSRAVQRALVVADLPFMAYQVTAEDAVRNAGRLVAEGGAQAVKLEGPARLYGSAVQRIVEAGIPVMGHLGLTPQSINRFGGFKVQGREADAADQMVADAKALEKSGCFSLVLECIPRDLSKRITEAVAIPTIGIGAGGGCDGQVLVMHDLLGLGMYTKFSKVYADVKTIMHDAFAAYAHDVKNGTFPGEEQSFQ
ncbi:MAG: 3-methyl-2-oxobutanoate hydroxymethyltransferase [Candidatus Hydrogenedentota bacterium]